MLPSVPLLQSSLCWVLWARELTMSCCLSAASLYWWSVFILLHFACFILNINLFIQNQKYSYHRSFSGSHGTVVYILFLDISSSPPRAFFSTDFDPSSHILGQTSSIFGMTLCSFWKKKCIAKSNFTRQTKIGPLLMASYFLEKAFCFFYFYAEVNTFCSPVPRKSICFPLITMSCIPNSSFECTTKPHLHCAWLLTDRKWAQDTYVLMFSPCWAYFEEKVYALIVRAV